MQYLILKNQHYYLYLSINGDSLAPEPALLAIIHIIGQAFEKQKTKNFLLTKIIKSKCLHKPKLIFLKISKHNVKYFMIKYLSWLYFY